MERRSIGSLTKAALQAAKARGVKLGGDRGNLPAVSAKGREIGLEKRQAKATRRASDLSGIIAEIKAGGAVSLRQIADGLNGRGVPTARGGSWSAVQVSRVLEKTA